MLENLFQIARGQLSTPLQLVHLSAVLPEGFHKPLGNFNEGCHQKRVAEDKRIQLLNHIKTTWNIVNNAKIIVSHSVLRG
jgi:hypothetical protein